MKSSELLRKAKEHLWDGDPCTEGKTYICNAISWCAWSGLPPAHGLAQIQLALKDEISRRLEGAPDVEHWLDRNVPAAREFIDLQARFAGPKTAVIQAYRHRWLDALIAEYEAKGD